MASKYLFLFAVFLNTAVMSQAAETASTGHKKITGVYRIYGGGLGDPIAPSTKDAKIMLSVDGKMAKEIFDAIGPDVKDSCTEQTGDRIRKKDDDHLFCSRTPQGEYFCNLGFDLKSGKSIGGIVC